MELVILNSKISYLCLTWWLLLRAWSFLVNQNVPASASMQFLTNAPMRSEKKNTFPSMSSCLVRGMAQQNCLGLKGKIIKLLLFPFVATLLKVSPCSEGLGGWAAMCYAQNNPLMTQFPLPLCRNYHAFTLFWRVVWGPERIRSMFPTMKKSPDLESRSHNLSHLNPCVPNLNDEGEILLHLKLSFRRKQKITQ